MNELGSDHPPPRKVGLEHRFLVWGRRVSCGH